MKCEEMEAMIFSGRKPAPSELEEMKAHAKTCEACRVLLQNADVLASARSLDAQIEVPASFTQGWRARVRQMPRRQSVLQRVAAYLSDNGGQRVMRLAAAACCAVALFGAGVRMGEGNRLNAADAASVAQDEAPMLYSAEMMPQVASRSRMADMPAQEEPQAQEEENPAADAALFALPWLVAAGALVVASGRRKK